MRVAVESWVMVLMGLADLNYTTWLLQAGSAFEVNPIMAFYVKCGLTVFVAVKLLLVFGPIAGLEWVRTRRPKLVERMLRFAIAVYATAFVAGFCHANNVSAGHLVGSALRFVGA